VAVVAASLLVESCFFFGLMMAPWATLGAVVLATTFFALEPFIAPFAGAPGGRARVHD
jgi:hypothetical protein